MVGHYFTYIFMDEYGQHQLIGVEKDPKNLFSIKYKDFDQSTINNALYQIMIIIQETTTKVTLYVYSTISLIAFEWTYKSKDN